MRAPLLRWNYEAGEVNDPSRGIRKLTIDTNSSRTLKLKRGERCFSWNTPINLLFFDFLHVRTRHVSFVDCPGKALIRVTA